MAAKSSESPPLFNPRPLFLVGGILLVLGLAVHVIHGIQLNRHAETWRTNAELANRAGKTQEELAALKRYLQFSPNDSVALLRYAQLLQTSSSTYKDRWTVVDIFQRAIEAEPLRHELRRELAKLLVELKDFREAHRHFQVLLRSFPKDGELLEGYGTCQAALHEIENAIDTFQKCVDIAPEREQSFVRLAWLIRHFLEQKTRADALMDRLVSVHPTSATAWKARGDYWIAWGDAQLADESFDKASQFDPDDLSILQERANLAEKRGRFDESLRLWREAIAKHPNVSFNYRRLAMQLLDQNNLDDAVSLLADALMKFPDDPELSYLLIDAHLERGELSKAEAVLESLPVAMLPLRMRDTLRAKVHMKRRQWSAAVDLLESVLEQTHLPAEVGEKSALALGECFGQLHEYDKEVEAYRLAVEKQRSSAAARIAYAKALLGRNNIDLALDQCRILAGRTLPPPTFWALYARVLVRHHLVLPKSSRDWNEVERVLAQASEYALDKADVAILEAEYAVTQQHYRQADSILEAAQQVEPDNPELWAARIRSAKLQGDDKRMVDLQQQAKASERAYGTTLQTELEVAVIKRDVARVATLHKQIERYLRERSKEKQIPLWVSLGNAYHHLGQYPRGNQIAGQVRELAGDDLSLIPVALELAVQGKDDYQVEQIVTHLRELEGRDGTWWRYAEAQRLLLRPLLVDQQRVSQALQLIREALARRPNWTEALVFGARLLDEIGETDHALEAYYRAFQTGDRATANVERLLELLCLHGRDHDADNVLRQVPRESLPPAMARLGAELALRLGQPARAITMAETAVPRKSDNFSLLIWLGNIYSRVEEDEEAKRIYKRAVELEGRTPDAWVALLAQLRRMNALDEAQQTFQEMTEAVSPRFRTLALALAHEALGQNARAVREFDRALEENPNDLLVLYKAGEFFVRIDRVAKAKVVLEELLSQPQLAPTYQTWARRELALVLAFDDSGNHYDRAIELLDANRANGPKNPLDDRARSLIQATRPTQRTSALKQLEAQTPERTFTNHELYRLASVYKRADDWPKASSHFVRLLTLDPVNPTYLVEFLDGLAELGKTNEVQYWLPKLEALDPANPALPKLRVAAAGRP